MLFSGVATDIARERASMLRDIEYIREDVKDSALQESILIYENCNKGRGIYTEEDIVSPEEDKLIDGAIAEIPDGDTDADEEIDRIVNSENDAMTIDQMMGIDGPDEPSVSDEAMSNLEACIDEECGEVGASKSYL